MLYLDLSRYNKFKKFSILLREFKLNKGGNKMVKKTISILLVFVMILSIGMPSNVYGEAKDYSGHWQKTQYSYGLTEVT